MLFRSEAMNIPAGFPDGTYGLSYTYYSGTSDAVEFTVDMFNVGGMLNGVNRGDTPLTFVGNYGLANINAWDDPLTGSDPLIVQTMIKGGFNYASISDITEPPSSSRIKSGTIKDRSFYQNNEVLKKTLFRLFKN